MPFRITRDSTCVMIAAKRYTNVNLYTSKLGHLGYLYFGKPESRCADCGMSVGSQVCSAHKSTRTLERDPVPIARCAHYDIIHGIRSPVPLVTDLITCIAHASIRMHTCRSLARCYTRHKYYKFDCIYTVSCLFGKFKSQVSSVEE